MTGASFYQILGVGPSASSREIKSAYRKLVKQCHPDLFTTASAKEEATEKLRQVNEAYAVLGNAKRRQEYDQRFQEKPVERAPAAAPSRPRGASPSRRRPSPPKRKPPIITRLKERLRFSKRQVAYGLAAAGVGLIVMYANRSVPRLIVTYALREKVELSPQKGASAPDPASQDWVTVGQFATVADCAGTLKERVRRDEQEGSRAAFGAANGTVAITVLIRTETGKAGEKAGSTVGPDPSAPNDGAVQPDQRSAKEGPELLQDGISKRVRNLECRAVQRIVHESWLRSVWQGSGAPS